MSGSKKLKMNPHKANKENFTVYTITRSSDSTNDLSNTFYSLPVHGTHSDTRSAPAKPRTKTAASSLRPSYTAMGDILPDLQAASDDEDEDSNDVQADDAGYDGAEDFDGIAGLWDDDDGAYTNPFREPSMWSSALPGPMAGPTSVPNEDEEMCYEPYEMSPTNLEPESETLTTSRTPLPPPPADPWSFNFCTSLPHQLRSPADPPSSLNQTTPAPPADPWSFNFSADFEDDQYLEQFSSDDQQSVPDDARYDSVDEQPEQGEPEDDIRQYTFTAPTINESAAALKAINLLLRPRRNTGAGFKKCELTLYTRTRLEWVASFLHIYSTTPRSTLGQDSLAGKWNAASLAAAHAAQKGPWTARKLRQWARAFMKDPKSLPASPYGSWNKERSVLKDADVANEIALHLQSIGKYVKAMDIVHYIAQPDVKKRLGLKKGIHLATAQRWMKRMGYRWTKNPSGQYVDGHERADVVHYRQKEFIPAFTELERQTRKWTLENLEMVQELPRNQVIVVWFHDESTFYAHDRRLTRWVHHTEKPEPRKKGEGASLMVSDFVSADYGWLQSKDGTDQTRILFKAGKGREGYFTNEDIIKQTNHAMEILSRDYSDEKHVFVFDNTTTHTKRAGDALSARKMPKFTPKNGKNFLVGVNKIGDDGRPIYCAISFNS
ncbi:hypothetical protein B0H12DRAFT_1239178 [Mycena haematopus]|nr:hypothetical protein B0H12DRAFT_1239178 [Mycena haematopus]